MLENEPTPAPATGRFTAASTPNRPASGDPCPHPQPPAPTPFVLHSVPRLIQCPPPPPDLNDPSPHRLAYGLTLPSATATPAVAQEAAWIILDLHATDEKLIDPALLLVEHLTTYACRFTASGEHIQLALHQADDTLHITVHDTHPTHTHPRLAAACDDRRRTTLATLPDLLDTHHGTWGFTTAHPPATGTRTWAGLPHTPQPRAA